MATNAILEELPVPGRESWYAGISDRALICGDADHHIFYSIAYEKISHSVMSHTSSDLTLSLDPTVEMNQNIEIILSHQWFVYTIQILK